MCCSRLLLLFLTSLLLAFLGLVLCKLLSEGIEDLLRLGALDALGHLDVAHVAALLKNLGQLLEAYTLKEYRHTNLNLEMFTSAVSAV